MVNMKIYINGSGRLGNNLFQYFFGKILSHELNCDFFTNFEIPNDFGISNKLSSLPNRNFKMLQEHWNSYNLKLRFDNKEISQNIDSITKAIRDSNFENIVCDGYFQNYDYYSNYSELIKNSFNIEKKLQDNTLGIHIRKGDIRKTDNELPDEWYLNILNTFPNHLKIITTDSPNDPIVRKMVDAGCELYQNTPEKTIIEFSNFSDLVLSQGTFSWWMGYLSDGVKHNLIPTKGWNSKISDIKLLPNEKNWLYYTIENNIIKKI
jgi:hypothetical protein